MIAAPRILLSAMEAINLHPIAEPSRVVPLEDRLHRLMKTGLLLGKERNPEVVAQIALEAAHALCGAAYGVFLRQQNDKDGHNAYVLDKDFGVNGYLAPGQVIPVSPQLLQGDAQSGNPVCVEDLSLDPRYRGTSFFGPSLPVRSLLAVALRRPSGKILGAMLFGHPEPRVFSREAGNLVGTLAIHTSLVLENLRLIDRVGQERGFASAARLEQRAADRRLCQALEATQLGTWDWSATTDLMDFDERGAELFGVPPHRSISRNELRERLVHPADLGRTPKNLLAGADPGHNYAAEYRVRRPDGSFRWVASSGTLTFAEDTGQPSGMIGTVQDITLRKRQEESLLESEKLAATGRMAATIAHEINNPLEAVTNLIYLAKTDPHTPAPVRHQLEIADEELARVSQIAQQTLGFYRDTTKPVSIDLNQLVGAVVELFGRKLAGKRLHVTLDLEPGLSMVGLQGEIRQVVSNLLVNAIDASVSGGAEITIRGRYRHKNGRRGVSVMISDQGTGIPSHVQSRLLTPFVTTKESRGTGLGLWVTRGMVEKHGGSVCFRSRTDPPTGTIFRIYLPEVGVEKLFRSPSSAVLQ